MKKELLLEIARKAIEVEFNNRHIDREYLLKKYPELKEKRAVFVTLNRRDGNLRGCIGSLIAHRTLLDDIISNAKASAFNDPRFPPLTKDELKDITIEISLLSPYKKLDYRNIEDLKRKIRPKIDGVILKLKNYQATFLPQVWEDIPDFNSFFAHLCQKAGINPYGCLEKHPDIFTYQVEKIKEKNSRKMSVAGAFYPESCKQIESYIEKFNSTKEYTEAKFKPKAVVVPHAGYIYSGFIANLVYRQIDTKFKRVVVIGPSHHFYFKGISIALYKSYDTPCGAIPIDIDYSKKLIEKYKKLTFIDNMHHEHSTEVQMPFIKYYFKDIKVVEIVYGDIDYRDLTPIVKDILEDSNSLLIVSTDLSHFYTLEKAKKIDLNCLNGVKSLNVNILNRCEACGLIGLKALVSVAKKSQIIDYGTSYNSSGDSKSVVGYMSAIFQ